MFVSKPDDISVDQWSANLPTNHILVSLIDMNESKLSKKLCTPCSRENETESACAWCINCAEALCKSCERYHRKYKFLSSHRLIDIESSETQELSLHHADVMCTEHPDELLKAYCRDHSIVWCMKCVLRIHIKCKNVGSIEDAFERRKKSKELENYSENLKRLKGELDTMMRYTSNNQHSLEKDIQRIKSEVNEIFTKLSSHLSGLKSDIMSKISRAEKESKTELDEKQSDIRCKISTVQNVLDLFQTSAKYSPPAHFLQATDKLMAQRLMLERFVMEKSESFEEIRLTFHVNTQLREILQSIQVFGEVNLIWKLKDDNLRSTHRIVKISSVVPTLSSKVDIPSVITGIVLLENDQIIMSNESEMTVELRSNQCSKILSSLCLPTCPYGIKMTSDTKGAVAVRDHGLVIFNIQNNQIIKINQIKAAIDFDFVYHQGEYYVGSMQTIRVYDSNLSFLRDIRTKHNVGCMAVRDNNSLCYTVFRQRELCCISNKGNPIFTYSHDKLQETAGVTVDHAGYIYVCGYASNNVHQLSYSGKLQRIIFDNLRFNTFCVSFNKCCDKAVLGCDGKVLLYDLKYM